MILPIIRLSSLPLLFLTLHASAITVSHTYTYWAGQGQCSAHFVLDSQSQPITQLTFDIWTLDNGHKVQKHAISIDSFGESSSTRYTEFYLEGEDVCGGEGDMKFLITNVKARDIDNKPLQSSIETSDFKPNTIELAGR